MEESDRGKATSGDQCRFITYTVACWLRYQLKDEANATSLRRSGAAYLLEPSGRRTGFQIHCGFESHQSVDCGGNGRRKRRKVGRYDTQPLSPMDVRNRIVDSEKYKNRRIHSTASLTGRGLTAPDRYDKRLT